MTNEDIIESTAFKAINLLIDQHASHAQGLIRLLPKRIEQALGDDPEYKDVIPTRVSYETGDGQGTSVRLDAGFHNLENIKRMLDEIFESRDKARELQGFKLKLLADWDWTRGSKTQQIAVFGEEVES